MATEARRRDYRGQRGGLQEAERVSSEARRRD